MTKTLKGIDNIASFVSYLDEIKARLDLDEATINPWYRGHGAASWKLEPSMYRCEVEPDREREMIRDFKIKMASEQRNGPQNNIDWLFLAQHHGLPTRALDWSENPLVALFFAVQNYNNGEDGEVLALNPWTINVSVVGRQSVPTTEDKIFLDYVIDVTDPNVPREPKAKLPMAFRPSSPFKRSISQSGVFTIHGKKRTPIENLGLAELKIERMTIPSAKKKGIFLGLVDLNLTHGSLFGDADSIAKSIRFRYSRDYTN